MRWTPTCPRSSLRSSRCRCWPATSTCWSPRPSRGRSDNVREARPRLLRCTHAGPYLGRKKTLQYFVQRKPEKNWLGVLPRLLCFVDAIPALATDANRKLKKKKKNSRFGVHYPSSDVMLTAPPPHRSAPPVPLDRWTARRATASRTTASAAPGTCHASRATSARGCSASACTTRRRRRSRPLATGEGGREEGGREVSRSRNTFVGI